MFMFLLESAHNHYHRLEAIVSCDWAMSFPNPLVLHSPLPSGALTKLFFT